MLRIFHNTRFDFIRWWRVALIGTVVWIVLGLASFAFTGPPNLSIEFTGGTLMQLRFPRPPNVADIRAALAEGGIHGAEITSFGSNRDYTVRAQERSQIARQEADASSVSDQIERILASRFPANRPEIVRREGVGPRVGSELRRQAVIAMILSSIITLIYLAIRFDWRFGVAAVLGTAHDVLATFAFIKLFHIEISLTVVAAILTLLGYSLNDTIIIFDRVRENLKKQRGEPLRETLNRSVNDTLPRSVMTHATVLLACLALVFLAGEVIRPFALVMTFGVFVATFSSIYVATPLLLWIESKYPRAKVGGHAGVSAASPGAARVSERSASRAASAPQRPSP